VGKPALPQEVMLFSSILYHDESLAHKAVDALKALFGEISYESGPIPFDYTSYYHKEMGSPLFRILIAFSKLVPRNSLPGIKRATNTIEEDMVIDGRRTINLDPGILSLENICLATTKPYSHRIYLDEGIWAEVTLMYQKDAYQALPWTYPDYASQDLIGIFNELRGIYKERSRCRAA